MGDIKEYLEAILAEARTKVDRFPDQFRADPISALASSTEMFKVVARIHACEYVLVRLNENWSHEAIIKDLTSKIFFDSQMFEHSTNPTFNLMQRCMLWALSSIATNSRWSVK